MRGRSRCLWQGHPDQPVSLRVFSFANVYTSGDVFIPAQEGDLLEKSSYILVAFVHL